MDSEKCGDSELQENDAALECKIEELIIELREGQQGKKMSWK